jgi:hypothetical protein
MLPLPLNGLFLALPDVVQDIDVENVPVCELYDALIPNDVEKLTGNPTLLLSKFVVCPEKYFELFWQLTIKLLTVKF